MNDVIDFPVGSSNRIAWSLSDCRKEYGLSLIQAAQALDVSPTHYERMEQGKAAPPQAEWAKMQFEIFLDQNGEDDATNLMFGTFPLRMARQLTGLSLPAIASHFGYSAATWKRFESNGRILDREKLKAVEAMVKDRLGEVCGP